MVNEDVISDTGEGILDQYRMTESLHRLLDSLPDGAICIDPLNRRLIMANPAAEKMFGYSKAELLGHRCDCLYQAKEEGPQQGDAQQSDGRTTAATPVESVMRKKDGTTFPAEIVSAPVRGENGETAFHLNLIRNILQRKEQESELRNLEHKFRTIADFTYDWECWLQPNGGFRYISPSCRRITGYSAEEFMNNPAMFRDIIHPDDRAAWDAHYYESRAGVTCTREIQFRIIRADGEVRWIEHACQPVTGDNQELQGFRSSNRDITKRKTYEQDLSSALAEIEQYKERLEEESRYLQAELSSSCNYGNIIGTSNALQYVFFKIEQVSDSDATVLLLGETGTGKELIARAIHNSSPRKDHPLVKVNCSALPPDLIENELFGHEKGAFTGADKHHIGRFGLADKGTIFLDEIGELPMKLQAKLLRVLQEGEFNMVGSSRSTKVDVRVIAATNLDLEQNVRDGLFRKDLFYRLNIFPITVPPLRDRVEDIPLLVNHFVKIYSRRMGKKITSIPAEVMKRLKTYPWPGNIRELQNVIERSVIYSSGARLVLADELRHPDEATGEEFPSLEELERRYILKVLQKTDWKTSGKNSAAEILGLKRSTLRARMTKLNIRKA